MSRVVVIVIAILVGTVTVGCGDDARSSNAALSSKTLLGFAQAQRCLMAAGARIADASEDLPFARADADGYGFNTKAAAGNGYVDLAEFSPILDESPEEREPVPAYLLWVAEPAAELVPDVLETADDENSDTFVAYMTNPSRWDVRATRRCLDQLGL
jgi:hypothetical protein